MRTIITQDPFLHLNVGKNWREQGLWPCAWVSCPDAGLPPFVTAYRRCFSTLQPGQARIHVAADERYDLYLDGAWIGRGNERGAPDMWFYESYDLSLSAGDHVLVARVWSLGDQAAQAQMSVHPGFLLATEGEWTEILGTGASAWEAVRLHGYAFLSPNPAHWRGARVQVDGKEFLWGYEKGEGAGWKPVTVLQPGVGRLTDWEFHRQHLLRPATLPPLQTQPVSGGRVRFVGQEFSAATAQVPVRAANHLPAEEAQWQRMMDGQAPLQIPAHSKRRVVIDLKNYYCAYPEVVISGGSGGLVRVHWAEALFTRPDHSSWDKGNRDEIEGKYFIGFGETFLPDGAEQRHFDTLWWQAGRYLEVYVETAAQPMILERLRLQESRYPLELESSFTASDPRLAAVIPILTRVMQMCSNETYFDCPYYEELQYAGDTRLEILTTYIMTRDDRLPRKALRMFDASRLASGLTQSRYPCRVMQIIPPFALWWVMMVTDYAMWRGDLDFVRSLLPGMRATLEGFQRFIHPDGLLYGPEGWNTLDWVPAWDKDAGVPPDGHQGASGLMNWQLVYALALAAGLEERLGEHLLSELFRQRAVHLAKSAVQAFWEGERGLLADDRSHQHYSEHTQCMAVLSDDLIPGLLDPDMRALLAGGLLNDPQLERTTIYFSHYLFETYRVLGRVDVLLQRMQLWFDLPGKGFKTTLEMPEPSRSDCHAWGAHPLYHYFATILGIRPAAPGFAQVEIRPQLGPLEHVHGCLVHPGGGVIEAEFNQQDGALSGRVCLPADVSGRLIYRQRIIDLLPGENLIRS